LAGNELLELANTLVEMAGKIAKRHYALHATASMN
jgi:hypothetical protein